MEKDISRRAVEQTLDVVSRVRALVKKRMPYGPSRVGMTPRETRRLLQRLDPEAKQAMAERMGVEEWNKMMEKLYGRTEPS